MEGGLGDAVRQVIELAGRTTRTEILDAPLERKGAYYLVDADGAAKLVEAEPAWHDEYLDTPQELGRFTVKWGTDASVFITDDRIVAVKDLSDRRDRATCVLRQSPQYQWLKSPQKQMSQMEFVRLLRIDFAGCLTSENLLTVVKQIKFDTTDGGQSAIEHGRQSMGRQVTAAVFGFDAIPEETALMVPVFENHPMRVGVRCAIEIFPQERTFKLTPYPLEVKNAMDVATIDIINALEGKDKPPVYRGKP